MPPLCSLRLGDVSMQSAIGARFVAGGRVRGPLPLGAAWRGGLLPAERVDVRLHRG